MIWLNNSSASICLYFMCIVISVLAQEKYYDRRYDYYEIDNLIQNRRLLKKYLDCFLEKGPCTPIGRKFKQILPEVVTTACVKCSPSQRRLARKTFNAFKSYFPDTHMELTKRLDPRNKYYEAFEKALVNA